MTIPTPSCPNPISSWIACSSVPQTPECVILTTASFLPTSRVEVALTIPLGEPLKTSNVIAMFSGGAELIEEWGVFKHLFASTLRIIHLPHHCTTHAAALWRHPYRRVQRGDAPVANRRESCDYRYVIWSTRNADPPAFRQCRQPGCPDPLGGSRPGRIYTCPMLHVAVHVVSQPSMLNWKRY